MVFQIITLIILLPIDRDSQNQIVTTICSTQEMSLNCLGVVKIIVMNKSILENANKMSLRVNNLILNKIKFRAINIKPKQKNSMMIKSSTH